jgi:hypothetical protein
MALPTLFANNTAPTGPQLDADLAALGALTLLPGTITGTNTLTLTLLTNVPTISAYANYMTFTGIAAATNTGATTVQVGSLAALNVYKDTAAGPVVLSGGEIRANCTISLRYDSALNSGSGGFHLISQTAPAGGTVSELVNFSAGIEVGSTTSTITRFFSRLATINWAVVAAQGANTSLVASGNSINDSIVVGPPASVVPGTAFFAYSAAAGTIAVVAMNITAGTLTPFNGVYRLTTIGGTP